ncbi:hypothetical protein [Halorussus litoreus]|uniref:hypothetical protein n=1 Tax=Halorussus litoreus TaxID=1710536 RepID=UPI001300812C|nr:hypothetical protein [Halorussus litoreus]
MNTAEVLVAELEAEGVEYVFGIPGEETEAYRPESWDDLADALDGAVPSGEMSGVEMQLG